MKAPGGTRDGLTAATTRRVTRLARQRPASEARTVTDRANVTNVDPASVRRGSRYRPTLLARLLAPSVNSASPRWLAEHQPAARERLCDPGRALHLRERVERGVLQGLYADR